MRGLAPTWATWCNGNIPKLGWNRGGVTQEHKKPAISPKRCKIGPRLLLWTNWKSHTRFRLVPKSTTLDDLERRIQRLPKVFKYPLLSQERVKLRTSNLAGRFHSQGPWEQKPIKKFGSKQSYCSNKKVPFYGSRCSTERRLSLYAVNTEFMRLMSQHLRLWN